MERSTGLGGRLWRIAQALGVLGVAILLVGLVVRPAPSLTILWRVLIPLVPATLLVSPLLWRNVCPLATLERGYAIVTRADGSVLQDAAEARAGDEIEARLRRGSLKARVT